MGVRAFNPNRPCIIGMEWDVNGNFQTPLQATNALATNVTPQTNQTIDTLRVPLMGIVPHGATSLAVEVLPLDGTLAAPSFPDLGDVDSATFYPTFDIGNFTFNVNGFRGSVFSGNNYSFVDSVTLTPGFFFGRQVVSNEFLYQPQGQNCSASFRFGSVNGTLAGRWITRVRIQLTVTTFYAGSGGAGSSTGIVPFLIVNGVQYFGLPQNIPSFQPSTTVTCDFYENPQTGLPWTPSDLAGFDGALFGANHGAGFQTLGVGNPSSFTFVEQVQLIVDSSPESRLAIGVATTLDSFDQGWCNFVLRSPNTGAPTPLALTAGSNYCFSFKETRNTSGFAVVNCIFSHYSSKGVQAGAFGGTDIPIGPPFFTNSNITLDTNSRRPTGILPGAGTLMGFIMHKNGGGISADSQPYAWTTATQGQTTGWPNIPNGLFKFSEISYGQWMHQQFTVDTNTTFNHMQVICSLITTTTDDPVSPLALAYPMEINIRRASDDALMAGPFNVQVSDLQAPVTGWQKIGIDIGAVALVGGVKYYWEVTSAASPFYCWQVGVAIGGKGNPPSGPPSGTATATWGNNVDSLIVYSFSVPTTYSYNTALLSVSSAPPVPTGFNAVHTGESACHVDAIALTWVNVALSCGVFGHFDLQRSDDLGVTWNQIARITDPLVSNFVDYESIRNKTAQYRIRQVRQDATPSAWSAVKSAMAVQSVFGLLFVSNEMPELNVFYPDLGASRQFSYPQAVSTLAPLGRNYEMVIHDLEYRGRNFKSRLAIRSGKANCPPQLVTCDDRTLTGTDVFNPLQAICRADLSYVCVHDEHGDRYFANTTAPTAEWIPVNQEIFFQDVLVVEVTNVPSSPDATH